MKNYFEGWYFKHVSDDLNHVYAFIPGVALTENDSHSFIQIINGITGETHYVRYPVSEFMWDKKRLYLRIGESVFSENKIELNIHDEGLNVSGSLKYENITKYPKSIFSPGIMGWYSFVPFMECKHGIISVNHNVSGMIKIMDQEISFKKGKGYIEKDWGVSFPESWIWIQSNNFTDHGTSLSFSVAKIPWRGKFFIGFIAFLYYKNEFFLFSTYNKSSITENSHNQNSISLTLKNRNNTLNIKVIKNRFGELAAPLSGNMSRKIKESIDSEVFIDLFDNHNNHIYSDSGKRAGLEVTEKIFDYL